MPNKLKQVKRGGDLVVAGEITGFDQYNKGVSADGYSSQVQLKMTVNVRFTNTKNHQEDFERQFSATAEAPSFHILILPENSFGLDNDDIYVDLDFADYHILVKIVRLFLAAGFALWLLKITRKVIGA